MWYFLKIWETKMALFKFMGPNELWIQDNEKKKDIKTKIKYMHVQHISTN